MIPLEELKDWLLAEKAKLEDGEVQKVFDSALGTIESASNARQLLYTLADTLSREEQRIVNKTLKPKIEQSYRYTIWRFSPFGQAPLEWIEGPYDQTEGLKRLRKIIVETWFLHVLVVIGSDDEQRYKVLAMKFYETKARRIAIQLFDGKILYDAAGEIQEVDGVFLAGCRAIPKDEARYKAPGLFHYLEIF